MSTVIEEATEGLREARNSLRRAEERLNNFMDANLSDFTSAGYLTLSEQVTACRAVVAGAQQTLQQALAQGNVGLTKGSRSSSESSLKPPHPKRKLRWEKLNEILAKNKRKLKSSDSADYSYVKWNEVKDVLQTTPYTQSLKAIPDVQLSFLSQYLSFASKCFGPVTSSKESQRLHLIPPIIICVCFLFN
jgi:hypothetical protein